MHGAPAGQVVARRGRNPGKPCGMRTFIVATYLVALLVLADWSPLAGLLVAALIAVWAFPSLRRVLVAGPVVRRVPERRTTAG